MIQLSFESSVVIIIIMNIIAMSNFHRSYFAGILNILIWSIDDLYDVFFILFIQKFCGCDVLMMICGVLLRVRFHQEQDK